VYDGADTPRLPLHQFPVFVADAERMARRRWSSEEGGYTSGGYGWITVLAVLTLALISKGHR
jgi:hypothetical protein